VVGIVAVLVALLPLPLLAGSSDDSGTGLAGALGLAYVLGARRPDPGSSSRRRW
jgi:hypothetical protein